MGFIMQLMTSNKQTMSSREIAELTGKEHKHVIRDIRSMLGKLKDGPTLGHVQDVKDSRGYTSEFLLDRYHTEVLITGYDVKRRAAVIERWFTLESGKAQPVAAPLTQPPEVKDPQIAAMVMMLTELDSVKQEQEAQRNELAEVKAKIQATPDEFYTVAGYASLRGMSIDTKKAALLGRKAAKLSREYEMDIGKAHSSIHGTVNTYHVDILCEVFE